MVVTQMKRANGQPMKGQFIIDHDGKRWFQSDGVIVAIKKGEHVVLDEFCWENAITVDVHRNAFLKETKDKTRTKLEKGIYSLDNLNY